jgi:hypothetical protein
MVVCFGVERFSMKTKALCTKDSRIPSQYTLAVGDNLLDVLRDRIANHLAKVSQNHLSLICVNAEFSFFRDFVSLFIYARFFCFVYHSLVDSG